MNGILSPAPVSIGALGVGVGEATVRTVGDFVGVDVTVDVDVIVGVRVAFCVDVTVNVGVET